MALYLFGRSKIKRSKDIPVETGATVNAEGQALIRNLENGYEVVKPSTGGDGDKFVGVSYGHVFTPVNMSRVENLVVPASSPYEIELQNAPLSGQILVLDGNTKLSVGDPAVEVNEYSISDKKITLHSDKTGKTIKVQYRYSPSAIEIMMTPHSFVNIWSADPSDYIGSIGVIQRGEIFTDQFDASIDWNQATDVKLAAGGLFTDQTGSGDAIHLPVKIIHIPTADEPFLGLEW